MMNRKNSYLATKKQFRYSLVWFFTVLMVCNVDKSYVQEGLPNPDSMAEVCQVTRRSLVYQDVAR